MLRCVWLQVLGTRYCGHRHSPVTDPPSWPSYSGDVLVTFSMTVTAVYFGSQLLSVVLGTAESRPEVRHSIVVAGAWGRSHLPVADTRQRERLGTRASRRGMPPVTFLQPATTSHEFPRPLKTALPTWDQAFSNEPGGCFTQHSRNCCTSESEL